MVSNYVGLKIILRKINSYTQNRSTIVRLLVSKNFFSSFVPLYLLKITSISLMLKNTTLPFKKKKMGVFCITSLRLSLGASNKDLAVWNLMIKKVLKRLEGWEKKGNTCQKEGKETLIKSMLLHPCRHRPYSPKNWRDSRGFSMRCCRWKKKTTKIVGRSL